MERSYAHESGNGESMLKNHLLILEESLVKKKAILDRIEETSKEQMKLLQADPVDLEAYDRGVDEKDACIQELAGLDEGFEMVYDGIREELGANREQYREQIGRIQMLISELTDKSVSIQATEERNRQMVTVYFQKERQGIGKARKSSKAAYDYYKSMNNTNVTDPYVIDQKN